MCRAGLHVLAVGQGAAFPGARLHQHLVARLAQRGDAAGHQPDARFVIFDFFWNADDHDTPSEFRVTPPKRGD